MSGADLANLVNEAALLATREDKEAIDWLDFDAARDKILMGAKREDVITEKEKRATAYHEVGHALVGWLHPEADPVHKVTIIPRGRALGVTQYLPEEDRVSYNETPDQGACSPRSWGAAPPSGWSSKTCQRASPTTSKRATRLARLMVTQCGMSDRVGPVFIPRLRGTPVPGPRDVRAARPLRAHAQLIDEEVGRILREADDRAYRLLEEHRDELERVTEALIEREVLSVAEIEELIGKRADRIRTAGSSRRRDDEIVASIDNPS